MKGGHLGWRAYHSRKSPLSLTFVLEADRQNTSLFNAQDLGHLPKSGQRLALSLPDPHNPQPYLSGNDSNYLLGTQPTFKTERGEVDEAVYGIWVDRGRGIVVSLFPGIWKTELICRTCIIGHIILLILGNLLLLDGLDIVCWPLHLQLISRCL